MSLRRKLLAFLHNRKKEAEYTELAYLESTGTQWIDTGFLSNQLYDKSLYIKMKTTGGTSSYAYNGAYHTSGTGLTIQFGLLATSDTLCRTTSNHFDPSYLNVTDLQKSEYTEMMMTPTEYWVNGEFKANHEQTSVDKILETNNKFLIFGRSQYNQPNSITPMIISEFWIKDADGKFVQHLIPVLDKDFVPCMYDKVTGKFFYNQGTGEFEWKLPNQLEYIRTENNSYTIIDVITDGSYTIEAKCRAVSIPDTAVRNFGGYMWQGDSVTYNNPRSGIGCYNSRWHVGYNKTGQAGTCDTNLHIFKLVEFLKFGENFNADYFSVDGEQLAISHASSVDFYSNTRRNWAIGGRIQSTGFKNPLDAEHYWWKFWDGDDKLVAYIIPVFDENLTPCFYDLVSKKYFYNKGSGSFTYE